jgi:serine/threonine protein kinase
MSKENIEFLRKKDYKYIKDIGQGGTGKTILIQDETINETFVCKKYSPYYQNDAEKYYANFLTEIKILHAIFHLNIVRVFNYYLYPERKTGYILMDYIKGQNVSDFISANPDRINDIFIQTINGFKYLEENNILHRDIRPENILVTDEGIVKIIDFGFGKRIAFNDDYNKSVTLNWRYAVPSEFSQQIYDSSTEVYFVGKLLEDIIEDNLIENFGFSKLLKKMVVKERDNRIANFLAVSREILILETDLLEFTDYEKMVYQQFAKDLDKAISQIHEDAGYIADIDKIFKSLMDLFQISSLEVCIQNPSKLVGVFIKGDYYYNKKAECLVINLKYFIELLRKSSIEKRKVITNNLWQRLDKKSRYSYDPENDLPF